MAFFFAAPSCCWAQNTSAVASQTFKVSVPEVVGVTVPTEVEVIHEATSGDSVTFPTQWWNVRSSTTRGAVAEFAIVSGFTHQSLVDVQADAELNIAIDSTTGTGQWQVSQGHDISSIADGDEMTVVQVVCDGTGIARLGLDVRMVTNPLHPIAVGTYTADVLCTVTVP